jgi:perosamine synthetase
MKKIKLFRSYIAPRAVWNVAKLLIKSNYGTYIGEGPEVKAFEKELAERFNLPRVVTVNSGTAALELAYELAGIGEGDEVITPILTCTATNIPLIRRGAKIVFADTERDLNVSVSDVERKISPLTKAIVFVHFGGNNRGLKELLEIAKKRNLILIEDAAQAILSPFWGKANFTCLSFQAIKTLTTGDGGALICKDPELDKKARRLRWFGYDRELKQRLGDTDLCEAGYKYHMSDITATIGRGNLRSLDRLKRHHQTLMEIYQSYGIVAYPWFAAVLHPKRDELKEYLAKNGVATGMYHFRNDQYTVFGGQKLPLPIMNEIEGQYLLLPLHVGISVKNVVYITQLIRTFDGV